MKLKEKLIPFFEAAKYAGGSAFELKFYNYMDSRGKKPNIDGRKKAVRDKMDMISDETLKELKKVLKNKFGIYKVMYVGSNQSKVDFIGFSKTKDKKIKAYTMSLKSYTDFYKNSKTAPQITGQAKYNTINTLLDAIENEFNTDEKEMKKSLEKKLQNKLSEIEKKEDDETRKQVAKRYREFWGNKDFKKFQKRFIETQFENLYKIASLTIGYDYKLDRFSIITNDVKLKLPDDLNKIELVNRKDDWKNATLKVDGISIATVQLHNKKGRRSVVFRFIVKNLEKFMDLENNMIVGGRPRQKNKP